MSQTTQVQKKRVNNQPLSDSDLLIRAKEVKVELEEQNKIPEEYNNLVREAINLTRTTAGEYIEKFQSALFKARIRGEKARLVIIADCERIGWKYNTIRKFLSEDLKPYRGRARGGRAAAKKRKENNNAVNDSNRNVETNDMLELPFEITRFVEYKIVKQIIEKSEFSLKNGGKGAVMISERIHEKHGKPDFEITNVASVIPTDKQRAEKVEELKN